PLGVGVGEARKTITDTALHVAFLLHCIQGGARVSEAADTEHGAVVSTARVDFTIFIDLLRCFFSVLESRFHRRTLVRHKQDH
ncbi:hypothetical protein D0N87_32265, partial [Pseudomonas sp. ATCC 13867]